MGNEALFGESVVKRESDDDEDEEDGDDEAGVDADGDGSDEGECLASSSSGCKCKKHWSSESTTGTRDESIEKSACDSSVRIPSPEDS